jgi:predicted dehydrogenase
MNNRRDFLKKMTAASVFVPLILNQTQSQSKPLVAKQLRVALVGLGSYAERVAEAMKDCSKAVLVGAVSGTPSKLEKWQKNYNIPPENCYSYNDFDKIINNQNIDIVYITLPNSMHHEFTLRAAKAGKHVLCEKPMSVSVKEAKEMIAACEAAKVKLYIGYRLHYEPFTRELIRMRTAGELGKIMAVTSHLGFRIGDPKQWRLNAALAGGGAMMDVGIYSINGTRYATGEDPIWVMAHELKTDREKFKEVDETITWQMGFPSGVVANCSTTYNYNSPELLRVSAEKGFVELSPCYGYGPINGRTDKGPINQPVKTHQTLQMDGLADCILNNTPDLQMDGNEGLKDMQIIEAIYISVKKGGKKVKIRYA